ncbi:Nodule Cysteine-Rich (NCR) secreted peptide [Medicago truncatula]|uniref:Nodule Cysteine-Rich (NCR) secreted peptide n=2 Tax=Medicago truncatula TaxID=3880 RepID=G7I8L8_MEDTR|nr:Nodule Cysteine-Rich (NCR) secreted peptide [Medicago truncatula]
MSQISYFLKALLIFFSLFLVEINGEVKPCTYNIDCPLSMCPSPEIPKCVNSICECK